MPTAGRNKLTRRNMPIGFMLLCAAALVSLPAFSQIDATGEWSPRLHEDQPERGAGPELGDYLGLPINDAARLRADSWDASLLTLPENQCRPIRDDYQPRGQTQMRIWKQVDEPTQQIVAYHMLLSWMTQERTIYMDGRPHPPDYAAHTWQGFSTGTWEGNMLTATTTHLKAGWIRRNGVPRSDRATLTEHWIRHGDLLTLVSIVNDPVYLTDPFIRTTNFVLDPQSKIGPFPCESVVEINRPEGYVPHHLPGTNPFLTEFAAKYGLPAEAVRGGTETTYPEYRLKLSKSSSAAAGPDSQTR
jgi:hypothetical protein